MIPLLLIAIALGAAALAYEVSPKARALIDVYTRAIRDVHLAHRAADAHLSAARTSAHPATAIQNARAAATANQVAAQKTADAAKTARTESERAATAESATMVTTREPEITGTLADAYLDAAQAVSDPAVAVEHVAEATEANRASAQKTAEAAAAARTEQERQIAAQNAAKVIEREKKIAAALAKLGIGQCGVRSFSRVTPRIKDALLARLHGEGMTVTGDNPWNIETHAFDVKLRAVWDPNANVLKLIVTAGKGGLAGLVTCDRIWAKIDPIMKGIIGV